MALLYAAKAGSFATSDLYTVDPATGAMTSVGPIGYAVTGLAVDPTSGILYGSTSGGSAASPHSIITIDKVTGAGTLVGDLGLGAGHNAADICFDAAGQLYGWDSHGSGLPAVGLIVINKATGAGVHVGAPAVSTNGDAMDFDLGGVLWLFPEGAGLASHKSFYTVDPATGAMTDQFPTVLGFAPISGDLRAGSVDATGVFYAVLGGGINVRLVTINTATGAITNAGFLESQTDALGWDNTSSVLTADFSGSPVTGAAPLSVAFTDHSTGPPTTWAWDFGDGGTSSAQNPTHVYASAGVYTVSLTVGDGVATDSLTRTDYITVVAPAPNIDCAHAVGLTPNCSSATINNAAAPDTPLADDPLFTIYGDTPTSGTDFKRQLWYRISNPAAVPKYARFTIHNPSAVHYSVAAALYDSCPPSCFPNDAQVTGTDGLAFQGIIGAHSDAFYALGMIVAPHGTVWIELASDDTTDFAGPARWDGDLLLTWELLEAEMYDTTDAYRPEPVVGIDCYAGTSETVPPHTGLDYSGFDAFRDSPDYPPFPNGATEFQSLGASYCRHGGNHWICAFRTIDLGYIPTTFDDQQQDQLGVWQIADDGSVIGFNILDTLITQDATSLGGSFQIGGVDGGYSARFASDGTNLWLCVAALEPALNPWDASVPQHEWRVEHVVVYHWSGSGWSRIGVVDSYAARGFPSLVAFDCCASPAETGVLHVVVSEHGETVGPDPTNKFDGTLYGFFPTGPGSSGWVSRIAHATFSSSARTSQFDVLYDEHTKAVEVEGPQQLYASEYAWIRNDDGNPLFVWLVARTDGTPGYQLAAEWYSISGGTATLIKRIGAAELDPTRPGGTGTLVRLTAGWLSKDAVTDVGFDSRSVYFLQLNVTRSGAPNYKTILRLDVADLANPRYFDDDALNPGPQLDIAAAASPYGSAYCDLDATWFPAQELSIRQFERECAGAPGWRTLLYGFNGSGALAYPHMINFLSPAWLSDDGRYFYYGGTYRIDSDPHGAGDFLASLNRTHILRDFLICAVGDCVASSGLHIDDRVHW